MELRKALIPPFAQSSLVPPIVQAVPIEPVRSRTIITCAGFGVPPRMDAVAWALIVNDGRPSRPAKNVFVGAMLQHDDGVAVGAQPPNETTHFVVTVVVTLLMLPLLFLLPGRRAVLARDELGMSCVRKLLSAGECSGVGRGLERAVRVIRVADVDDQCCEAKQHDHHQHHENDDLTALVLRSVDLPSCQLVRNHGPEPPQSRRVRTTPVVFQLP